MLRSASKRRRSAAQSACRLDEADLLADMDVQNAADASCVLGLTASPKVDSIISPPRRSPRLHASSFAASSPVRDGRASTGLVSPSRVRSMTAQHQPSPGPGILGQLAEEQLEEEQALQRLVTPRKHSSELPAALGSGRKVMQALLSEEAEQAVALDQLLSPRRRRAAATTVLCSTSRASCGLGNEAADDPIPLRQDSLADRHNDDPFAGMRPFHPYISASPVGASCQWQQT